MVHILYVPLMQYFDIIKGEGNMEAYKVLLLVDENQLGDKSEQAFYRANFNVLRTSSAKDAVDLLHKESPDAMVGDSELINSQLAQITHLLKHQCRKTAFVLLSNHTKTMDRIHALEDGADDLVDFDSELDELIAKVKALVRRISLVSDTPKTLNIRDISINLDTHEVRKAGKVVDLTYTQFKLLYLLASQRESVFSRNDILSKVWGENTYVTDRTVDVHVKRLREKLGERGQPSRYIQTIHGLGYRFS